MLYIYIDVIFNDKIHGGQHLFDFVFQSKWSNNHNLPDFCVHILICFPFKITPLLSK